MLTRKKATIEFFMVFPIYIALSLVVGGLLLHAGLKDFVMGFFLCYFVVFINLSIIIKLIYNEKLDIVICIAVAAVMSVMFRDKVLIINILAALGTMLLIYVLRDERIGRFGWIITTVTIFVLWQFNSNSDPRYAAICFVALGFYSISVLLKKDIRYFAAVPLIIALVTLFTPIKDEPYQWPLLRGAIQSVKNVCGRVSDEVVYFFEGLGFSGGDYSGYSESGKVSGSVTDYDREEVEFVNPEGVRDTTIYLKGRSYTYLDKTGFSEEEVKDKLDTSWFALYLNAMYHNDYNKYEAAFFSRVVTSDVTYKYIRTEDTIMPLSSLEISKSNLKGKKKRGYNYHISYMLIDYGSPYFKKLMKQEDYDYENYETIAEYTRDVYSIDLDRFLSPEEYEDALREKDMTKYLDTSMATDRIVSLTEEITEGAETDYEKACRIEEYLRQYEYSKSVDLSDSENYIDDFLFDTQKGYCIHYASAMVLMLRASGIPAKFSIGYKHDETDSSAVLGSEAHAWPEAYISGYGWVPFEPTVRYLSADDTTWGLGKDYNRDKYDKRFEKKEDEASRGDAEEGYHEVDIPVSDSVGSSSGKGTVSTFRKIIWYIILMLAALFAILVIFVLIRYIRYRMMSYEDRLKLNMKHIFELFSLRGREKLEEKMDAEKKEELEQLLDNYRRVRFRGDPADSDVVNASRKMRRYLWSIRKSVR